MSKKSKKEREEKSERSEKVVLSDSTVLVKVKPRPKGGPKTKLLELIPKKGGITLKKLTAAAKDEELPVKKVKSWAKALMKYGFARAA